MAMDERSLGCSLNRERSGREGEKKLSHHLMIRQSVHRADGSSDNNGNCCKRLMEEKCGVEMVRSAADEALSDGGPPQLRITAMAGAAPDFAGMMATRKRLLEFADMFTIITDIMEDLQP
ncbi:hypothetical protein AXG93_1633s1010 [Marchantia polymorpha subsp. ruderalis]|uniref:Uncharacterized protein n=1 Tax=Marchantia polymorpha subsp. ruderalis TaxID=1480154 RepID=A0A176VSS3_MARPO|nr:hypothetical protein AXG93_1633s1010 [Marchantia polymorpha subsp. ruderalis]